MTSNSTRREVLKAVLVGAVICAVGTYWGIRESLPGGLVAFNVIAFGIFLPLGTLFYRLGRLRSLADRARTEHPPPATGDKPR